MNQTTYKIIKTTYSGARARRLGVQGSTHIVLGFGNIVDFSQHGVS